MTREGRRGKRNRRLITLGWVALVAAVVIFLLYKERADWLYVIATLGVTTLLIIVAASDLGAARKGVDEASLGDDSAALGSNIPGNLPATATAPSDWRGSKKRRPSKR
jgi:hypothetical protein